jgi:hypothetical protein
MFDRFWERLAIRVLMRSKKITMLAFKDRDIRQVFIAAAQDDEIAWAFLQQNQEEPEPEPQWFQLERAFHSPDAESDT